jgi:large subunit ribosomal protein L23
MLITPRATEKSYKLTADNVYVFDVPLSANKAQVTEIIEQQNDGVKVRDVRLLVVKGKPKAVNRGKRSRPTTAKRKDSKKAYVVLSEGKIEVAAFAEYENAIKEQAAAEVSEAKEAKPAETKIAANAETKKAGLFTKRRTGRRGDK